MEDFNGRPVWHCSVSPKSKIELAAEVIRHVGQGAVMLEDGHVAIHLRRWVTDTELEGLDVKDIRGTLEAEARLDKVRHYLPVGWTE